MKPLTPKGEAFVEDIAKRYHLSNASALQMLVAVRQGGGTMAQFSCPELGSGQWMRGGMTMVGDMFNHALKAKVNDLCSELSAALAKEELFEPVAESGSMSGSWWPPALGTPSSRGAQNHIRYAVFPQTRRLAVERAGRITIYDTGDHRIGGVSQQQGGETSLSFSSQHGTITTSSLPVVSGDPEAPQESRNFADPPTSAKTPPVQSSNPSSSDITGLLEKLGKLRDSGVLTDGEFAAKKKDLLARL